MGTKATREISKGLGSFPSTKDAWDHRVQAGQNGGNMSNQLNNLGRPRALAMLADWTDRIAAGEVPQAPPRPQGTERNVVISMWDWADPKAYLHDEVASDKRNPRVNAKAPFTGPSSRRDYLRRIRCATGADWNCSSKIRRPPVPHHAAASRGERNPLKPDQCA
jgi:hypothetical protein